MMNLKRSLGKAAQIEGAVNLSGKSNPSATDYCLDSLRRHDYENFVCTLLLKEAAARNCALAVRAFNVEVARISEQVSQPSVGMMRMQFWEEALEKCYSKDARKVPQHPVALQLHRVLSSGRLSKRYFKNLLSSRTEVLKGAPITNLEALEKYCEKSVSSVYYLVLESAGIKNLQADHAASHLGKAQGIVQHIRCLPLARRLNFVGLPRDVLAKHKVSEEDVMRGTNRELLKECTYEAASRAHQHLEKARSLSESVPKEARNVLLPAIIVGDYLERLQRVDCDVFHPELQRRSWLWLPKLWLSRFQYRY